MLSRAVLLHAFSIVPFTLWPALIWHLLMVSDRMASLKRFQAKWAPVRRPEARQDKDLKRCAASAETGQPVPLSQSCPCPSPEPEDNHPTSISFEIAANTGPAAAPAVTREGGG